MQKLRDETKKYRDEAKKYTSEAKKYRNEILKLVDTSKASSKTGIDTGKIIGRGTDNDSYDEEAIEVIDNNVSINEKIIEEEAIDVIDNNVSIDEKIIEEETIKVMDDNDSINEKTPLQVFEWVRKDIKNNFNWEKRRIVWIFWKSHVTELCEKWIYFNGNYAYTRFEEFRTCSGEVLFTNEQKSPFQKTTQKPT